MEPVTEPPSFSRQKLLKTIAISFVAAGAILIAFVLPAEYNIDPLHTGRALGLTAMRAPVTLPPQTGAAEFIPAQQGPIGYFASAYREDTAEFTLGPYEYIEYKYRLEKGASILFSWMATEPVIHDFHGKTDLDKEESYDKKVRSGGNGSFTAPFSGIHGWYWENPGDSQIIVNLKSTGFYSSATEFRMNRKTVAHQLAPVDAASVMEKK